MNKAKWIWKNNENKVNTWMCFVKDFSCGKKPNQVMARIAVDTKYWLFLNGEMVVFEGGLKRGRTPESTYYDELDLSGYLKQGRNRIAVLVWYFGKSGFSHVSSGRGGFFFEASIGDMEIFSDESWKVKKNEAYVPAPENDIGPNFRLAESDIYYDASLEIGAWYLNDYSVDAWDTADILNDQEQECFGVLEKRQIPLFKEYGLKDFLNSDSVKDLYVEKNLVLEMRLPYNMQFTPFLELEAPAGKRITIKAENYHTNAPGEKGIKSVYITKNGGQKYESLGWLNGERIGFEIPSGVTIRNLKYRETGYDTEQTGSFWCDDEFLNRLWQKCYRTLYLSMRDTFMDCPDRERTQWWGDVNIEMQMLLYCMDQNAAKLYEKGADSLVGWYEATGNMLTVVPSGIQQFELPFQNLAGIYGFYVYYVYSGNLAFARNVYQMSRDYVLRYEMGADGLVVHREGSWDWPDWGKNADIVIMENALYCMALDACMKLAKALGKKDEIIDYQKRFQTIQKQMLSKRNAEGIFYDHTDNGLPDDRANALAVLAGFVGPESYGALTDLFSEVENASPYMEKYVLDALCEMDRAEDALARMRRRYGPMAEDDYSTLWELWDKSSSLNHAWSGGPLITMSKYIAGISVDEQDCLKYRIRPRLGQLKHVKCSVPTKYGILTVQITKEKDGCRVHVDCPEGIAVTTEMPEE